VTSKFPKTVHITNYYHRNSGGISTSYNNLLAAAGRHKRYATLIVPGETESVEQVNEFAKIHFVPAKYSPVFDKRYRIIMPWQYMPGDSLIRKILLEEKPDIVEVTDKYTLSMLGAMIRINKFSQLGRPILVHFSCERMDDNVASFLSGGSLAKRFARRVIGNYTIPSFDYHIANSTYTAEEFFESVKHIGKAKRSKWFLNKTWRWLSSPRVPVRDRVIVCPRGVDAIQFTPERRSESVRQEMIGRADIPENAIILLYAGRISPEKNVGLLVDLMENLAKDDSRDYRLLVAGAGPQSEWLEEQAYTRAPGKIIQLGHLDKSTLADYYANSDVFVHPNPKEPFGIAPLEAMASGVPTVAPKAGGILSYATNENAWLVEPSGDAFAAAIRSVVDDPEGAKKKVENAVETARSNTREAATDRLFAAYDRIYEDFHSRRELFTDMKAAKEFDFAQLKND
jgi:alpha-1,6-mannosyltransferase